MSPNFARKSIIFILRFIGINALLALVFLLMPFSQIIEIHSWLDLGEMPDAPIVRYLTRAICLSYAVFGAILMMISFDIDHYQRLVRFVGILFPVIGVILLWVDIIEKLPFFWILSEGPFMIVLGVAFLWLLQFANRGGKIKSN